MCTYIYMYVYMYMHMYMCVSVILARHQELSELRPCEELLDAGDVVRGLRPTCGLKFSASGLGLGCRVLGLGFLGLGVCVLVL